MEFEEIINSIQLGDCYELIKNIPSKSIDLVIIDPPYQFCAGGNGSSDIAKRKYNQKKEMYSLDTDITKRKVGTGYSSGGGCFGTKKRNYHSEINLTDVNMTPERKAYEDYVKENGKDEESERLRIIANAIDNKENTFFISKGFSNEILDELVRVMKKINIYIWCSKGQLRQIIDYFDDLGCNLDLLTWHKTNPIPTCNNTYLSDTEYCVFAREEGVRIEGTVETKKKYYVTPCNVYDKEVFNHPTIKPLQIIKNFITNSSNKGDIVLDTFVGSGTTCVAAKELGRKYIGIELNPEYHKIAVNRLNGITASGQMSLVFDENGGKLNGTNNNI
jgi:DNA modification methylase